MFCPRCGFEQHVGAMFCPNCGWLIASDAPEDDFWRLEDSLYRRAARKTPGSAKPKKPTSSASSPKETASIGRGESAKQEPRTASDRTSKRERLPTEHPAATQEQPSALDSFAKDGPSHRPRSGAALTEPPERPEETAPAPKDGAGALGTQAASETTTAEFDSRLDSPSQPKWEGQAATGVLVGETQEESYGGTPIASPQVPALTKGEAWAARPPRELELGRYAIGALGAFVGIVLGATLMFVFGPRKTEFVEAEPLPTPATAERARPIGGLMPIPAPATSPGPLVSGGPDQGTQNDLRNALIAEKKHYVTNGRYSDDTEALARQAPEVVWEPGITPSREGVVAVMLCGPDDPSTPVLLQAKGPTGRYYGIYDVPSGPGSGVYYAQSAQSFQCPNSAPPANPWQPSLAGWGIERPDIRAEQATPGRPEPSPPSDAEILGAPQDRSATPPVQPPVPPYPTS